MTNTNPFRNLAKLLLALLAGLACSNATAQIKVSDGPSSNGLETIEMTISPAGESTPIFKHRFSYLPHETVAGNAATAYLHSFSEGTLRNKWLSARKQYATEVENWCTFGEYSSNVPEDKLKAAASTFDEYVQQHIVPASKRRDCDWGYGLEELEGPTVISITLGGLHESRSIARVLGLRARAAILESRFSDATESIRMNYRLGENIGQSGTLVGSLVGFSCVNIANNNLVELIATPGAPNMYWALTELPDPIVDIRKAYRLESQFGTRIFPVLADAETAEHTPEEWARIVNEIPEVAMVAYQESIGESGKLIPTLLGVLAYPKAKKRLIESGMENEKVEAMAVGQALLIDANREYRRYADMLEKEIYLPAPKFLQRASEVEKTLDGPGGPLGTLDSFGGFLANMMLPAAQVRMAQIRVQREIAALRVIEAIRMHMAKEGRFPKSLSDITVVPVPENPATGKPFQYTVGDDSATIELPSSDGLPPSYSKRFMLTAG